MQRRNQCMFYAQGRCTKGSSCDFAHDSSPKRACMYYPRGTCALGSRCRYEHSESFRVESSSASPSLNDSRICTLAVADGNCPLGESCEDIHGNLCPTCRKYCLHPWNPEERAKHVKECKKQALERSKEIECVVCFELVLSKTPASERLFGLLSGCDHTFCLACIKRWCIVYPPPNPPRVCPVCRKVPFYIIPSRTAFLSKQEKQDIVNIYSEKVRNINCRFFNYGNGSCRNGTNCFYKHEVKE